MLYGSGLGHTVITRSCSLSYRWAPIRAASGGAKKGFNPTENGVEVIRKDVPPNLTSRKFYNLLKLKEFYEA